MKTFDLTNALARNKKTPDFEEIKVPDFDDLDEAYDELNLAEDTLIKYKQMLKHIAQADEVTGDMKFTDLMTEHDEVEGYDDSSMDIIFSVRKHLNIQILKMQQYCMDVQDSIDDMQMQEIDDERFGIYEDQVRSLFYSTR